AEFLWVGAIGLDGNLLLDALQTIGYRPRGQYHLFPSPGPLLTAPGAANAFAFSTFEAHPPMTTNSSTHPLCNLFADPPHPPGPPCQPLRRRGQTVGPALPGWGTSGGEGADRWAPPRGRRERGTDARRQGARGLAQDQPGRHAVRPLLVRGREQLWRRARQGEAEPERTMARRLAARVRGVRRERRLPGAIGPARKEPA